MTALISRLRGMIGDAPKGAANTTVFTDDQLQEALDATGVRVVHARLVPAVEVPGTARYSEFHAPYTDWEDNVLLYEDDRETVAAPDRADLQRGVFTFDAGKEADLLLVGWTYDLYAAAADLVEQWGTRVMLDFNFESDGQQFSRSHKHRQLMNQASVFRRRSRPRVMGAVRPDVNP